MCSVGNVEGDERIAVTRKVVRFNPSFPDKEIEVERNKVTCL